MVLVSGTMVFADDYGLEDTAIAAKLKTDTTVPQLIGNVIGQTLSLVAVMFFLLVLFGGFRWMFSRGNPEETKKALDIIFGAVVGLIIVLASYAITSFVFTSLKVSSGGGNTPVVAPVEVPAPAPTPPDVDTGQSIARSCNSNKAVNLMLIDYCSSLVSSSVSPINCIEDFVVCTANEDQSNCVPSKSIDICSGRTEGDCTKTTDATDLGHFCKWE